MFVGISADTHIIVLIRRDGDVVHGSFRGFFHAAQLGVHQQAALILGGSRYQGVADRAVVGFFIVLLAPEIDPGQAVLYVVAGEAEIGGVLLHAFDQGVIFLVFAVPDFIGFLRDGRVLVVGHHIKEVLADRLGVYAHEQGCFAFTDEIPHVLVGLFTEVVELEHLVQGLQGQRILIAFLGNAFRFGPVLGHEVEQQAGVQHLLLDLVAVLDQRHAHDMVRAVDVFSQLVENLVLLGLLPAAFKVQRVVRVDLLQFLDKDGKDALAAAGVADRVKTLAVGLFDGLLEEFFKGHVLRFRNHFFHGFSGSEGAQGKHQCQCQEKGNELFHTKDSFIIFLRRLPSLLHIIFVFDQNATIKCISSANITIQK